MDPLDPAATYSYLGFTIAYKNRYWAALYKNLVKSRIWWFMVLMVL